MKVRRSQLKDTVVVETRTGEGAHGPVYAPARTVRCEVDETRRLVRDANGDETVSEATLILHPHTRVHIVEDDVVKTVDPMTLFATESRVVIGGRASRVLSAKTRSLRGYAVQVEVTCA